VATTWHAGSFSNENDGRQSVAVEIGTAYVNIVPSAKGFKQKLEGEVDGPAGAAGDKASGSFGSSFVAGVGKAAVLGGAALAGIGAVGVAAAAGFGKSMNEVFTLLPGITESAMVDMESSVKEFSKEFGVLPNDVVPALYQSLSAGVPQDNVFAFLETAQKAAAGGVTDLTTAVDGISSVVNAYGSDVVDAATASDLMFTAVRLGKTNFEELSASLFQVTPIASSLGVQFGDVSAGLAALTAKGVPTAQAATQIRGALAELGKEGTKASDAFKEAAGVGFQDFIAGGGDLQGALQVLEKSAASSGVSMLDMFSSIEAGQAALSLTGDGTEAFTAALAEMETSAGATDGAFETMTQGLSFQFDQLKAQAQTALIDIGGALAPVASQLLDAIGPLLEKLGPLLAPLAESLGQILGPLVTLLGEVAGTLIEALTPLLEGMVPVLGAIIDALGPAFMSVLEALLPPILSLVEELTPLLPLFAEIAGLLIEALAPVLGTLLDALVPVIGALVQGLMPVFEAIKPIIPQLIPPFQRIAEAFGEILVALLPMLDPLLELALLFFEKIQGPMLLILAEALALTAEALAAIVGPVAAILAAGLEKLVGFISELFTNPGAAWESFVDGLSGVKDTIVGFFKELPGNFVEWVKDVVPMLLEKLGELGTAIAAWIVETVPELVGTLAEWGGAFLGWIADALVQLPGRLWDFYTGLYGWILFEALPKIVSTIAEWGGAFIGWVAGAITSLPSKLNEFAWMLLGWIRELPGKIADAASGMWDGLVGAFKLTLNALIDVWNRFHIPAWSMEVPTSPFTTQRIGMDRIDFPDLPKFHRGGVVPGPRGAEVPIMALAGETVLPVGATGSGFNVTQNIYGTESQRTARESVREFRKQSILMGV
jgi:TP901 family phage tail tape measure protein